MKMLYTKKTMDTSRAMRNNVAYRVTTEQIPKIYDFGRYVLKYAVECT